GPTHNGPAPGVQGCFPFAVGGETFFGVHRGEAGCWHVLGEPRPCFCPKLLLLGGEFEIHYSPACFLIAFTSILPRESPATSALWACAAWWSPNTESIPERIPMRSSA